MSRTFAADPTVASNSARATTRSESAFRIDAPNSEPRNVLVVALEPDAVRLLAAIAKESWRRTRFRSSVWLQDGSRPEAGASTAWFDVIADHARDLVDEIAASDVVVMVATAGAAAPGAEVIGEACAARAVKTSGIIIQTSANARETLTQSLRDLRPWARTLSVISEADMVEDMIHALGA